MEWLSEIRKLRKNVPVGIQVARRLLERTGGDVDEAIKLFHIDQINILTAKADVTHQEAENVLLATNYDIAEALRRIDEQRYTLTELILRKNKDAGDALNNIALAIEYEWDLKRKFWFGFADIQLYVDLSTVGEGYAADHLARLMEQEGISRYLVSVGGALNSRGM
ncbi:FAD:protein FMN transferase, partial [Escherichia coli]